VPKVERRGRLIHARGRVGLTQGQLAERIGIKEQAIQRYEATDFAGVRFDRLIEIAEALDPTVRYDVRRTEAT
jgi:HTH-type transcriptional regulator/antitoxin HipB